MTMQTTPPSQIIHNVATLDIRTATEATLANIKLIDNVAILVYSPETAAFLPRLNIGNVATAVQAPAHAAIVSGQTTLGPSTFQYQQAPLAWIVSGQLFVDAGLSAEELEKGVEGLIVSGQILCPEHLSGVLNSKLEHLSGQLIVYPPDARLIQGKLALTESYLRELPDDTKLVVLGKLLATQAVPAELLAQKLREVQAYGKVICAAENSSLIRSLHSRSQFGEVEIVPTGFEVVERSLVLDVGLLETLSGHKLYCMDILRLDEDVTPEALDRAIDQLSVQRLLLAPHHLRATLAQKCDLLNTKAIFYTGTLWLLEDEVEIDRAWFEVLEGQATLVVLGTVNIDPAIDPEVLATRLHRIHNLGEVAASPAQLAILRSRVGLNEGEWQDASRQDAGSAADSAHETVLGNAAHLRL